MASKIPRFVIYLIGGSLAGFILIAIPTFIVPRNTVQLTSDLGSVSLGFLQIAALYFPALAIFSQVLLEFSYRKADIRGKSGGVGIYDRDTFRWGVILTTGVSSLLLILGILTISYAITIPRTIEAGVALIVIGMLFGPLMLVYVAMAEFRDLPR